jgi:hypothetical protein
MWRQCVTATRGADAGAGWRLAHAINRASAGTLLDDAGRAIDWRNELGQLLVAAQRVEPAGHGAFWEAAAAGDDAARVRATAFALLALEEL